MQKVRDLLPREKPARHLLSLTDQSFSYCQKVLCGERRENLELIVDLLRSDMGREVLFALMGDANPDWFSRYRKLLDVNEARKQLMANQRAIEAIQQDLAND